MNYIEIIKEWFLKGGFKIVVILVVTWLILLIFKLIILRAIKIVVKRAGKVTRIEEERIKTLTKVFKSTLSIALWTIAVLMILREVGIDVAPLLAGAGLVGLSVGMGARSLIQDYLAGVFILLEDQYRVGEEIELDGKRGRVVNLTLRRTILENPKNIYHYIPNGKVKLVSNFSRRK